LRVAVVAGPDPGHAFPAAALAQRLATAGHRSRLYTGLRFADRMNVDGIETELLPLLAPPPGDADRDFGHRLHCRAGQMAVPLARRLAAFAPDLVVCDALTAAGALAADLIDLPWVELVPHLLHLPSRALPPPGTGLAPGRGPAGRARDRALRWFHARSLAEGARQRAEVRAELGLPAADPGPARRMVATLPRLEYSRPDWPVGTHLVGPLRWDPADRELAPPPGDQPLVFVSGSTSGNGRPGLLAAALAGLGHGDLRVAGTVLCDDAVLAAGQVPPWAAVGVGRQEPLLAAAAVAVTGGGHGMVTKALLHGVPLVMVPGGGDQPDVVHRVRRAGAGVVLGRLSGPALAGAVRRVLADPGYRVAACRLAGGPVPADPVTVCLGAVTGTV
jgi:UDP:flavonoid glycosyltransferase YjiC (YdhE family)